eukprot:TRINITY_DN1669_c0_g1_i1.p1 TRINITY_DN1669_c0_g1~~TRINITY_DN1669_c0_g1_i1.p1  ORF type:complete len:327 (+),score=33.21 TRINITY_DN1669_c0_g1_i1:92-1072(+)
MDGLKPVIRGECVECGHSRNLWVNEFAKNPEGIPCCHRDRGCRGVFHVAFTGPKAMLPAHLHNVRCRCEGRTLNAGSAAGVSSSSQAQAQAASAANAAAASADPNVARLAEMGFPPAACVVALQRCRNNFDDALEWLMSPGGQAYAATFPTAASGAAPVGPCAPCGGSAACPMDVDSTEVSECSICRENLLPSEAAMRCHGQGGRKHYFHAHCLTAWIRRCRNSGQVPTCPECRGPVQVQKRRLEEFLRNKQGAMLEEDRQAFQDFRDAAAAETSSDGWSMVSDDLWKVGVGVAVVAGVGLATFGIIQALTSNTSRSSGDSRRSRR